MKQFDVPIVLFTFKRKKVLKVLEVIKKIDPAVLYILSDGGRNVQEQKEVNECRESIDYALKSLNNTRIIKRYSEINLGVFKNIGLGSMWVLSSEKKAIFIEDDNLPEESFFYFCKEMLEKYESNKEVLWICGTNYLESYASQYSYVFTQHMLPCGWATWSDKFVKSYDAYLKQYSFSEYKKFSERYASKALFKQFNHALDLEKRRISDCKNPLSWDYQMDFTIKYNNYYGICPTVNQIRNKGADDDAIHGGSNIKKGLASKFRKKRTYPISFPLVHPDEVRIDSVFERKIGKIMLGTFPSRLRGAVFGFFRKIFHVPYDVKFLDYLKRRK